MKPADQDPHTVLFTRQVHDEFTGNHNFMCVRSDNTWDYSNHRLGVFVGRGWG